MNLKFFTVIVTLMMCSAFASARTEVTLEKNWKFTRSDNSDFSSKDFNDAKWQTVTVPHDWAIYGPFSINNDKQKTAIVQDGQKEALEHAGRTGGLPFVGVGWYRLKFSAAGFTKGKRAELVFDGAMSHAQVYVNGQLAGSWPYGYNSFTVDVTSFLNEGGENTLAVRLENMTESSRWYPGAGLYRNVHLVVTDDAHIPTWGTFVTTPDVTERYATVNVKTELEFPQGKKMSDYRILTVVTDAQGREVARDEAQGAKFGKNLFNQDVTVERPALWDVDNPNLYTATSKVYEGSTLKDEYTTTFGIRTLEFVPEKGFFLNGKATKFRGVCNHHDLGPLGGVANEAGIRRQIRIMKDMGVNAIRTSHNMPAPELVKTCDEMGMMLMPESFDEWKTPKLQNGYHKLFDQWAEKDLVNLIRHYRNSPAVVMWCVGNEVPDQVKPTQGPKLSLMLQQICHREDPTRPVTQGMDNPDAVVSNGMAAVMDIPGFNYRPHKYVTNYEKLPQRLILGSETTSTVSSRGVYKFPVKRASMQKYPDNQASSYDVEHCGWSELPEDNFILDDDLEYCMGQFVWTGFDYLGEPTPYYTNWPSHSSLFGIVDLAGLPKDRYYLYRSQWNKKDGTLHVLPHWNWKGREGEVTPIFVYTNYPSAEVFINGKSQGKRAKNDTITVAGSAGKEAKENLTRLARYRLMWMETKYEPGEVKVVAYDENGKAVAETVMRTAGEPHHLVLEADRSSIKADGKDLSFVTVKVVDKDGNLCPTADNEISYKVKGAGEYRAGANGNSTSLESFQRPRMKAFSGMMTAIVGSNGNAGTITLEATAKGLKKASIEIHCAK